MSQIKIIIKGNLACPHFICDICHHPITEASHANLTWEDFEHGGDARIVCKSCEHEVERDRRQRCWMDLDTAWWHLKVNSHIDAKTARKNAELLSML